MCGYEIRFLDLRRELRVGCCEVPLSPIARFLPNRLLAKLLRLPPAVFSKVSHPQTPCHLPLRVGNKSDSWLGYSPLEDNVPRYNPRLYLHDNVLAPHAVRRGRVSWLQPRNTHRQNVVESPNAS